MKYRGLSVETFAGYLDHSVLNPTATAADVLHGAVVAMRFRTATYCVRPIDISLACRLLEEADLPVATVIGFPHGTVSTATKEFEATEALNRGARELDMVINQSWLLSGEFALVERDIAEIVGVAKPAGALVKVILENANLNPELIVTGCKIAEAAGADFVKTSTGFATTGAKVEDVKLMRSSVSDELGVKASGGITSLDQAIDLIEAGATRLGLTRTEKLFEEFMEKAD